MPAGASLPVLITSPPGRKVGRMPGTPQTQVALTVLVTDQHTEEYEAAGIAVDFQVLDMSVFSSFDVTFGYPVF